MHPRLLFCLATLVLSACAQVSLPPPPAATPTPAPTPSAPASAPVPLDPLNPLEPAPTTSPTPTVAPARMPDPSAGVRYELSTLTALPAWSDVDAQNALPALRASCAAFEQSKSARAQQWRPVCQALPTAGTQWRAALSACCDVYRLSIVGQTADATSGLMTGYYEPLLRGSRRPSARYRTPIHRAPKDLVAVDLADAQPQLRGLRLRGRVQTTPEGTRIVPYDSRAALLASDRLRGLELFWLEDPIEAFFLQVQGSGRIQLDDGSIARVGYADSNGHAYQSIGKWLIDRQQLSADKASMQGISAWARAHPAQVTDLLNQNPSYVFFRELTTGDPQAGPLGALNVPLTAGYSIAVDPRSVPLGTPVLIRFNHPIDGRVQTRWVAAQDTGSAIRGPLRFDLYWGSGSAAGNIAGKQRSAVQAWIVVPRGVKPESLIP